MAAEGKVSYRNVIGPVSGCEMKKFVDNAEKHKNVRTLKFHYNQLSTGSAVEVAQKTGTAITEIGNTELTLVGAFSADDNYYDGSYVFISYKSNDGVMHYAYSATNTTSTTEVAFTEYASPDNGTTRNADIAAVTDAYAIMSISIYTDITRGTLLATQAAETFGCGSTGALTLGVVAAEASSAVESGLHGIGTVYGRYHTNHNNYDGSVQYMEYSTPWGEVKWAHCTTNTTDSTTEVIFYEATNGTGEGTTTATSTTIKDFYRVRWLHTTVTPNATHTFLLTDAACANVDGSGTDVYAMIEEAYYISVHSRYHCPLQHNATLINLQFYTDADATNFITVAITYTPINIPTEVTMNIIVPYQTTTTDAFKLHLKPGTDISFTIIDAAGAKTIGVSYKIIEAEDKYASY